MLNATFNPTWPGMMNRQPESPHSELGQNRTKRGRILVVDDDSPTLALTREILEDCGYEVTTGEDGLQALDLFSSKTSQFDMVITDHHMPRMTGLRLATEIRMLRSDVPIILCSGDQKALLQARKHMVGCHRVMHKPVNARELMSTIRRMLETCRPSESNARQMNGHSGARKTGKG